LPQNIILNFAMSTIDIDLMTQNERLKLIQTGLTYVVPKLKHTDIAYNLILESSLKQEVLQLFVMLFLASSIASQCDSSSSS